MIKIKKEKTIKYICFILFFTAVLSLFPVNIANAAELPVIQSETYVLMDGETGQVLLEKNMNVQMYPASITKVMTALLALERGNLSDIITMSRNAVYSIGRGTSHIALDETERLTLEQALYGLAIESANDAANGIAELIGGSMPDFAKMMTAKAKELGALNTNFANAHGLHDVSHYTSAYDMALILSAAVKFPEFQKMFTAVKYEMPPTNIQPETRYFNRKNSLVAGPNKYEGLIAEKTGWTSDSGFTYVAAATRSGRTLVAVVMRSPSEAIRWADTTALLDYGFNEFTQVSYNAADFAKEKYVVEFTDGSKADMKLIPDGNFNCLILKSLSKEDIEVKYTLSVDGINDKMDGKAIFSLKQGVSVLMYNGLGKSDLKISLNSSSAGLPVNNVFSNTGGQEQNQDGEKKTSAFSVISKIFSVILQIIGIVTVIYGILYLRKYIIVERRKKLQAAHKQKNMQRMRRL